eukprot:TRINITY_DN8099_c0_g1_i1.p1 TRINITY_DN8099_c0_g1~~TRINITY_DN8099_c0_g1_i1.p1  ORF type:complete len:221 (+),score=38.27 TRINITY_DN8099_c0_g1_i1:151-813(+)
MGACNSQSKMKRNEKGNMASRGHERLSPWAKELECGDDNAIIFIHPEDLIGRRKQPGTPDIIMSAKLDTPRLFETSTVSTNKETTNQRDGLSADFRSPVRGRTAKSVSLKLCENFHFFQNERKSSANGDYIDGILAGWKDDDIRFIENLSDIKRLFPIYGNGVEEEEGLMYLTPSEAEIFRKSPIISKRIFGSYELVLRHFGVEITNPKTGKMKIKNESR